MDEEFLEDQSDEDDDIILDDPARLEKFKQWQKEGRRCCGKRCFEQFRVSDGKKVWLMCDELLRFGSDGGATMIGKNMRKVFIASIYATARYKTIKNEKPLQHVIDFIIPYYARPCCRLFFREMLGIGHKAMNTITCRAKNTVVPRAHGLTARTGIDANKYDESMHARVVLFVKDIALKHGMPWPVRVRMVKRIEMESDDDTSDDFESTEYIMPASFTKKELHRLFLKSVEHFPDRSVSWPKFLSILDSPMLSNVRINKAEKGVCGTCLSLCSSLRKQRADGLASQRLDLLERVRIHLNLATAARRMYSVDCAAAKNNEYSVVSWDFATKVKIPTFQNETQSGFQAVVHGLDYNVFGIVNEGATSNMQLNILFKEGRSVYADVVISLVHYYLSEINVVAGKAPLLILWMDSCSGQNRNQFLMQYLYTRVLLGLHQEIRVKYMVNHLSCFDYVY